MKTENARTATRLEPLAGRYRLFIRDKNVGDGVLSVGQDGTANFFEGDGERESRILGEMERTRLMFIAANGISLSGFEWTGKIDRLGLKVYRYAEWWISYL